MADAASDPILIIGAGHAGTALCAALAANGQGKRIRLIGAEADLPYQRPPLSKSFLKNPDETLQGQRSQAWFAEQGIALHLGDALVDIDRAQRRVRLQSGQILNYSFLVLATGALARRLPALGEGLSNVAVLRTAQDARGLRQALQAAQRVTVLGGGFIGLEIAATAQSLGKTVTVLESAPRLLGRSLCAPMAEHVLQSHRQAGIELRLGIRVDGFQTDAAGQRLDALHVDGRREALDLLVLGIGAVPDDQTARAAGLLCDNGIVVDGALRTADPAILAIGDCANFPDARTGQRLRLESVQNANDQARSACATLLGRDEPYRALPWFWSEQGALRLQMAGLLPVDAQTHRRPGATPASFSLLHNAAGRLACVESMNASGDHIAARKLMEAGKSPAPEVACDPSVTLRSLV